jgi:hypothetical protein
LIEKNSHPNQFFAAATFHVPTNCNNFERIASKKLDVANIPPIMEQMRSKSWRSDLKIKFVILIKKSLSLH